jgi:hypothetical protein
LKKKLYYHVYLTDDYGSWSHMIIDQIKLLEDHGLLKEFNQGDITITCITQNDQRTDIFLRLINDLGLKGNIYLHQNSHSNDGRMLSDINSSTTITENVMMQKIYEDSLKEDFQLLYIHTKGITSVDNHLKKGNIRTFINYYHWRKFLEWGVIERWRDAVDLLRSNDIVGVNYFDQPARHFSGGFWWANSSYIRTLPNPATLDWWRDLQSKASDPWLRTTSDRFRDEMWPCYGKDAKIASIKNLNSITNLSNCCIKRADYDI